MTDDAKTDPALRARRAVLDLALGATAGGVGLLALLRGALRHAARPPDARRPRRARRARRDFAENSARVVSVEGEPVLVIALPGGEFRAFGARCTHLGCVVTYRPATEQIECPCHGGRFGADGRVLAGPPPSPLRELAVVVRRDEVLVMRGG